MNDSLEDMFDRTTHEEYESVWQRASHRQQMKRRNCQLLQKKQTVRRFFLQIVFFHYTEFGK